jgi:hypothetical protein
MIAFSAVEGIFFFLNELISRGKGMHCDFACLL